MKLFLDKPGDLAKMAGRHDEEGRDLIDSIKIPHHKTGTVWECPGCHVRYPGNIEYCPRCTNASRLGESPRINRIGPPMSNKDLQQAINDTFDMWCECDLNQKPPERIYEHLNHLLNMQAARSRLILQPSKEQTDE